MESMVNYFNKTYHGKKVYITGITGFKGAWLAHWLKTLGAEVRGFALEPDQEISHFELLKLEDNSTIGNIMNSELLEKDLKNFEPDIVFHLAAQSLVRRSYVNPIETYNTNVIGTLNVLEACRKIDSVKAIIVVTSDKVYENKEKNIAYKEFDELGGYDLYSSSKACAEVLVKSYRNSFLNLSEYKVKHSILLATVRAGNVIGGGDWAGDRLVPDIIKATIENKEIKIRNPFSVRPWQHVLDPLSGYILLGSELLNGKKEFADAWNFGPDKNSVKTVADLFNEMKISWDKIKSPNLSKVGEGPHEAKLLSVDSAKAISKLKWSPVWDFSIAVKNTTDWYKRFYTENELITSKQIEEFCKRAKELNVEWAK